MDATLETVVAVVRTWNNNHIRQRVGKLLSFLPHVVVLVNEPRDKGATRAWLSDIADNPRLDIIELDTGKYFWALPLNAGLSHIDTLNASRKTAGETPFEFVFPCSVEADFKKKDLEEMVSHFADPQIGIVGTKFRGIQDGNEVCLTSYSYSHPRNTGMLIRLAVFPNHLVRDFDAVCDGYGGMEDIDFINRMLAFTDYRVKMLRLYVSLAVGIHQSQPDKERQEREAMRKIAKLRGDQAKRWMEAWRQMGIPVNAL